jgi:hypothetical protein
VTGRISQIELLVIAQERGSPNQYVLSALDSFDWWSYLASHGDLITAFGADPNAAERHYVVNGFNEGRALDSFDEWSYLASHGDLITGFGADPNAAVMHYVVNGFKLASPAVV